MKYLLYWCDRQIPFNPGEMLAYTLLRECKDESGFGKSCNGQVFGLFCGIGACQGCLVTVEGRGTVEACLMPASEDMRVHAIQSSIALKPVAGSSYDSD